MALALIVAENGMDPNFYPLLVGAISAVVALAAALVAFRTATAARKAQIILDFSKRDADPEMGRNIKLLWDFAREDEADLVERLLALEMSDKDRYEAIENARRIVHKFFLQLMQAKQLSLISDKEIVTCFYRHQLETVVRILRPLEETKPGWRYTRPVFDEYSRLYNNYDALYKKTFGVPL